MSIRSIFFCFLFFCKYSIAMQYIVVLIERWNFKPNQKWFHKHDSQFVFSDKSCKTSYFSLDKTIYVVVGPLAINGINAVFMWANGIFPLSKSSKFNGTLGVNLQSKALWWYMNASVICTFKRERNHQLNVIECRCKMINKSALFCW